MRSPRCLAMLVIAVVTTAIVLTGCAGSAADGGSRPARRTALPSGAGSVRPSTPRATASLGAARSPRTTPTPTRSTVAGSPDEYIPAPHGGAQLPLTGGLSLSGVSVSSPTHAIVALGTNGDNGNGAQWLVSTGDGGRTWNSIPFSSHTLFRLASAEDHDTIAAGQGAKITHDGGRTWRWVTHRVVTTVVAAGSSFWLAENTCPGIKSCPEQVVSVPATGDTPEPLPAQLPTSRSGWSISTIVRINAREAFVGAAQITTRGPIVLFATYDGGHSWQQLRPPCVPNQIAAVPGSAASLWMACPGPVIGMGPDGQSLIVYRSDDAGRRWTKASSARTGGSINATSSIVPTSPADAYALGDTGPGQAVLATTRDGGRTWTTAIPAFGPGQDNRCGLYGGSSNPHTGEIALLCFVGHGHTGTPVLATTTDGGRSWRSSALPGPPH